MLISLEWLKQYVEIKEDIKELENTLTMIGQEVEAVNVQGEHLDNVVIGKIVEYGKHPEADKLTLLKVDIGDHSPLQIVCGAPNHKLNDKVVVALIGAILPGDFKIKKSKIRGIESYGMLCSEVELGLGNNGDGIIILPEDAPIGKEYREYANLNDVIFELEITPNRPDCLSYMGIAREIAAYYDRKVKCPDFRGKDLRETLNAGHSDAKIQDKNRCKRYVGKVIKNVKVGESPEWLKKRLRAMGLNPVNNVVDATNYILFESNQPLHAYDLEKITDRKLIVRKAEKGEKLVTLDGVERELNNEELVIADTEKVLGIAGIIGGDETKVTAETTEIFLECAYFTPDNIRKTSKKLGISTDASYRFERGIDMDVTLDVAEKAARLISFLTDGEIVEGYIDKFVEKFHREDIPLDVEKFQKFVGRDVEIDRVAKILVNLGIKIKILSSSKMIATAPSYRGDLTREADLYEEIIRMYGFENIESKLPKEEIAPGKRDKNVAIIDEAKNYLVELGLQEVINYSFISKGAIELLGLDNNIIEIKNPISDEMAIMRPVLSYSLLTNIRDNFNRNQDGLRFFEVSKVFEPSEDGLAKENINVAIAISGKENKNLWNSKPESYDFYDIKGYVEKFLELLKISKYQIERSTDKNYHPGRSADIYIGKIKIGTFGEIHPTLADKMDIKKDRVYLAELNLNGLQMYRAKGKKYERVTKYPEVTRDLAVVLDREIAVGTILDDIKKISDLIENVSVFDIYTGEKIENSKKSVAINYLLRKKNGTLEEGEITDVMNKILELVSKKYNGEIRQ